ncbi:hypothetical protein RSK20926_18352 [Roseobacter sp. SK209-2-6]|uniref:OmpH family outer membrane protein n=1 Tax=Roseobacter sp. SK209-2-6 TaxID=388739 RepID=UPI0000F3F5FC|nr:OmpH family outer membrane protein [Roseobacter sp. SK209-2-6]EBA17727.1 hypothetical protein RSK20926_18352 [Roseobacter sp. SK209-2-6]
MAPRYLRHKKSKALVFGPALFACFMTLGDVIQAQQTRLHPNLGSDLQFGAPQSGVLTIEPERLFVESAFGKRVIAEIEAEGAVLTAENRRIEAELRQEEQDLTVRRPEMEPEAFRALADAFDAKVQETRRLQQEKLLEISQIRDDARVEFALASKPILEQIMREAGAGAILDLSAVFIAADSVDVTDLAIDQIDRLLGDGAEPDQQNPEE